MGISEPPGSESRKGSPAGERRDLFAGLKPGGGDDAARTASGASRPLKPQAKELPVLPLYEIVSEIADVRGGRAFHARVKADGKDVVVKVLERESAKDEALVERFTREALALRRLAHPNIVQIRAASRESGMLYYVTEFVTEQTLADLLKRGPLDVRRALSIGIQIANALILAHGANVVHRDVSPSSIVVTEQGIAKLFNFAFVKNIAEERQRQITSTGDIVGDITYSSPEQAIDPTTATPGNDVYALGATVFHAIAGRPPFQGRTPLEQLRLVISQEPPRLAELLPLCPARVSEVIGKMLRRDPEDRYKSADEALHALHEALAAASQAAEKEEERAQKDAALKAQEDLSMTGRIAAGLGGEFSGVELVEIVQFLEFTRKTGVLEVASAAQKGEIYLRDGLLVGAKAGREAGEKAATALLLNTKGSFHFRVVPAREKLAQETMKVKASAIAMEVMRKLDELSSAPK